VVADYRTIENEVKAYSVDLASRAKIVVLTKIDASLPELVDETEKLLKKVIPEGSANICDIVAGSPGN
jgi:GTPase involved in cell partitioning and DNA repair